MSKLARGLYYSYAKSRLTIFLLPPGEDTILVLSRNIEQVANNRETLGARDRTAGRLFLSNLLDKVDGDGGQNAIQDLDGDAHGG